MGYANEQFASLDERTSGTATAGSSLLAPSSLLRKILPTAGVPMSAKKRARYVDTDGDRTGGGGGGGGGGSDDSAASRLRPEVGARVVFAKKILQPGGTSLMGCFDAVVQARPMLDEEGGGIRLGQGGSEWDEALCNVYEIGIDGPGPPTTRCQGIRCSHFPPSKWAAFRRKCQLAQDERSKLDNDCRELALLIPEGVGRPRRLSSYVIGILSHGRAG